MITLNVKIKSLEPAHKFKKHDIDMIVHEITEPKNEIWVQVRNAQARLVEGFAIGDSVTIDIDTEYSQQSSGKNGNVYRHNNVILKDIRAIVPEKTLAGYPDELIISEIYKRSLASKFRKIVTTNNTQNMVADFESHPSDNGEKIDLFINHASNLNWQQWNHIFKEVARKDFQERRKLPHDYSLVLNESIS